MMSWSLRRMAPDPLLDRARRGDADAIDTLLSPHDPLLYRLCLAHLTNPADAEDAVQETLVRAIRALPRFRGEASLATWLVRIARNVCRARRPSTSSLHESIAVASPEVPTLDRLALQAALATLSELQRTCLLLQAVEGWSMAEIARSLNVNDKKVENELYRARRALARWEENDDGTTLD